MGRIKQKLIKSLTIEAYEKFGDKFTTDFNENKVVLNSIQQDMSKKMRNVVAGYAARLKKQELKNAL